ncbi:class I SAM-dependent methyltransferase [Alloiococcus sp. CFN-8]|uniref:class I SAM-dependent methyltransferase n=1 Tax=Alloiococcus sp. CFN-8 TaxID=3416081 RepID=UPI003CE6E674
MDKKIDVQEFTQKPLSKINESSWNKETYDAWINRFGTPEECAERLLRNPHKALSVLDNYLGDVKGKRIMNLMGSNGIKAVALSIMGAEATVVDFSHGNKTYALNLADAAGAKINYILSDILKLQDEDLWNSFDIVFAEMGIIHYFTDLVEFMSICHKLLKKGGLFILRDFHPVSTKLISSKGSTAKVRKHKVTGDYFDTSLQEKAVAYSKYSQEDTASEKVYLRLWNLGEIITSASSAGFIIKTLTEEPNLSSESYDKGIPKTFTLTATK